MVKILDSKNAGNRRHVIGQLGFNDDNVPFAALSCNNEHLGDCVQLTSKQLRNLADRLDGYRQGALNEIVSREPILKKVMSGAAKPKKPAAPKAAKKPATCVSPAAIAAVKKAGRSVSRARK